MGSPSEFYAKIGLQGFGLCAAVFTGGCCAFATSFYLGKLVYPLSIHQGEDLEGRPADKNEDFFTPNGGLRINIEKYKNLSTIRKISMALLMVGSGVCVGAFVGGSITGFFAVVLNPSDPIRLTLIGTVISGCVGVFFGGLHDPKIRSML